MKAKLICSVVAMVCVGASIVAAAEGPALIPWPRQVETESGTLLLPSGARIAVEDKTLLPFANVLAAEMQAVAGCKPQVIQGRARAGDIRLELGRDLKPEAYTLKVTDRVRIVGQSPTAVAAGSVTLLQLLAAKDQGLALPKVAISDQPGAEFRGLMIDVARQPHTIATLKKLVELCRWYKVQYLQLHLTDDSAFTFPSTAYPQLATRNWHFSLDDLRDLESFATERGVVVLPELETPGHASAFLKALPEVACDPRGGTLCPSRAETMKVLDTVVGELCDVFQASPYIHIGADEVGKDAWSKCRYCQARMAEAGLSNPEELYRDFLVRMNQVVKKHGRKTIVWEGFAREGKTPIPRDITVMGFESLYNRPDHLVQDGYTLINTAWKPLYVVNSRNWTPEYIYGWNMYRWENWWDRSLAYPNGINVPPTPLVIGAELCAWEQGDRTELPSLRQRLAAMSERIWNPGAGKNWGNFADRLAATDQRLDALLNSSK